MAISLSHDDVRRIAGDDDLPHPLPPSRVELVVQRVLMIERALQLDHGHATMGWRTPVPLQLNTEPRHFVIIFVRLCKETPTRWSS